MSEGQEKGGQRREVTLTGWSEAEKGGEANQFPPSLPPHPEPMVPVLNPATRATIITRAGLVATASTDQGIGLWSVGMTVLMWRCLPNNTERSCRQPIG